MGRYPLCLLMAALPLLANAARIPVDGVVAHVNQHVITFGDVMRSIEEQRMELRRKYRGAELESQMAAAYSNALNGAVERKLIADAYEKEDNKIPDDTLQKRVDAVMRERSKNRAAFRLAIEREGLTVSDWKSEVRSRMLASYMKSRYGERRGVISPKVVSEAYEQNLQKYRTPQSVRLRMIVIGATGSGALGTNAAARAKAVRQRLLSGEDFAAVAKDVSNDAKAAQGGDWGWMRPDELRAELSKAVLAMKPGEISEAVEASGDYYIMKLEERKEASVAPFVEVQPDLEKSIRSAESAGMYGTWIARLKGQAYIEVPDIGLAE